MNTHRLGARFEEQAAAWLESRGWRVLERNVRFRRREIDLIVRRDGVVAFVEVKGRRGLGFGHPSEAVTRRKRMEIESVALWWVARNPQSGLRYRFDVVAAVPAGSGRFTIEHLEDAWRPG